MTYNTIITNCIRPSSNIVEGFRGIPVANICDALGKPNRRTINPNIRPAYNGIQLFGSAITVREMPSCNLMTHAAIDLAKSGDVLVIDVGGSVEAATGGFLMARKMISKGISGVVVDGAWRDKAEIIKAHFPVYTKAWQPVGPHKDLPGSVNTSVNCGGVIVEPGDIIVGDDDGVVIIPRDKADYVLNEARKIMHRENIIMNEKNKDIIERPSLYATEERLREMGVEFR